MREVVFTTSVLFPLRALFFFSCLPLLLSVLSLVNMTKSKVKSSNLRSTQGDFQLQTKRHVSLPTPRVQSRSCSPVQHGCISPSSTSTPPRMKVAFADFADFSSAVRVSSKRKNRTMQKTAPLAVLGQAPRLQYVQLGLTLVVLIRAPVVSPAPRLLFLPLNHPLSGSILQQFLLLYLPSLLVALLLHHW